MNLHEKVKSALVSLAEKGQIKNFSLVDGAFKRSTITEASGAVREFRDAEAISAYLLVDHHIDVEALPVEMDYTGSIHSGIPVYSVRLVGEGFFPYGERSRIDDVDGAAAFLTDYYSDKPVENVVALFLDTAGTVVGLSVVHVGTVDGSTFEPRDIIRPALLCNAASIIVAHNHPSGNPQPSRNDIRVTRMLKEACDVMRIDLLDHLIIAEDRYTSLAQRGVLEA